MTLLKRNVKIKKWNVSEWWLTHSSKFPLLSRAIKAILCVPASSANCERCFSTCTDLITKRHNCLKPETVKKLTFLKDNLQHIPE